MNTNCIVCNAEVKNWDEAYSHGEEKIHPIGGTVFRTYGHYGSTVFDPMDGSYLEIVVCDDCLTTRKDRSYLSIDGGHLAE